MPHAKSQYHSTSGPGEEDILGFYHTGMGVEAIFVM